MRQANLSNAELAGTLKSTFGYGSFRPLQEEIVSAILAGQDVFVLMPTGGGKSLCYQMPALLLDGMTVVVSPLIALMKDQVDSLCALGIAATYINSSLDQQEVGRRQSTVARGEVKLLYVAPERLMQPGFLHLLTSVKLACFAIDEAHCISEWGHDFRPEYRQLKRLREIFPNTTMGAFTATATGRVQNDIKAQLGLAQARSFRGSFNRPNLVYDIRAKDNAHRQLVAYLRQKRRASGIIYCHTRAGTEQLAARLRGDGIAAAAYHAGLEAADRRKRQEDFIRDDVPIIVATIAFGMGIDKPDVRFVIHYDAPKSLEGYYQESGRAGRDGGHSDCILFYSHGDAAKYRHFIAEKPSEEERRISSWQLQQMVNWATGDTCRRRALLAYFDEPLDAECDPCCDVCLRPKQDEDCTIPAQMFLSCAKRTGERFGSTYLIEILRGSREERVLRNRHDKLSTYGIGRDRSKEEWSHLSYELLSRGYTRLSDDGFSVLTITDRGKAVLFKGERVVLPVARAAAPQAVAVDSVDETLFEQLRALRKRLADERGVPPYVVFHDATLRQMAAELPMTSKDLLRLQGVGQRKVVDFGDAFLACIAQHVEATGIRPPARRLPRPKRLAPSHSETLELFRAGRSTSEIAAYRGLALSTIEGHLAEALELGERLDLERLVPVEKQRAINEVIAELGSTPLKPLLDRLGNGYSYAELRFVRAALAIAHNPAERQSLQRDDRQSG